MYKTWLKLIKINKFFDDFYFEASDDEKNSLRSKF